MTEHVVSVVGIGGADPVEVRYRALCTCGFRGVRTGNRIASEAQAEQHLAYQHEAARIRGEQP